jgi:4-hydroxy-2-oxoheptanedioate aldolase
MDLPVNRFKQALRAGRQQIGIWNALPDRSVVELLAGSGFDWMMLDTEHSAADPITMLGLLQAVAPYPVAPVVRPASNDTVLIKRFLDVGAQTLLVPYVQTAAEAQAAVAAVRYPPRGVRGISSISRATRFGRVAGYAARADSEICLLVQVETVETIERIEEIAAVDGVDGLFVGPGDLAATLGYPGEPGRPEVVAVIEDTIRRIVAAGKPAGILTPDPAIARRCIALGTTFTAVGIDAQILARATEKLAADFRA